LRLGCGAVDLIRENDLPYNGTGTKFEFIDLLVVDGNAGHIARKHVWSKLDAIEDAVHGARQAASQHGLADAGHVLDQHMSLTQQANRDQLNGLSLPHNDLFKTIDYAFAKRLNI